MTTNFSFAGCTDLSNIPPDYLGPVYHDPSGVCYPYGYDGEVQFYANYGYNPALSTGIVFTALFGLLMLLHLGLCIKSGRKWIIVNFLGALTEVIGWIGRALSGTDNSASVAAGNYFLIQICCLTIAPTFFSAACYGLFVSIVNSTSPELCRISPKKLAYAFVASDIISLVLQAAGGGIAASANTKEDSDMGTNIMVAGIAFQLCVMVLFSVVGIDFLLRRRRASVEPMSSKLRNLSIGVAVASFLIILRGCYRTAELSQGWTGYLITHEGYFLGLDAVPMLLCLIALAAVHPLFTLHDPESAYSLKSGTRIHSKEMLETRGA